MELIEPVRLNYQHKKSILFSNVDGKQRYDKHPATTLNHFQCERDLFRSHAEILGYVEIHCECFFHPHLIKGRNWGGPKKSELHLSYLLVHENRLKGDCRLLVYY